ncbi:hypothetical protein M3664_04905 [Paenibacillus lautus]|uniref:hypothetical protein n=1 Tax=Paenibacillus lautus TaxID=1401 RepID=UPI00203AF0D3|nr:hypothetical protein [Paenibacillus lautus]MCM3257122.1 hypothetical protein [Paenibacillus lautus]
MNKIDEIKKRLVLAPFGSDYDRDVTYLLQEIERKDEALKRIEEELTDDTSEKAQRINEIIAREAL